MTPSQSENTDVPERKRAERRLFIFLVVFLFPILAVAVVGGYGFIVWMTQIILGPPGPPA